MREEIIEPGSEARDGQVDVSPEEPVLRDLRDIEKLPAVADPVGAVHEILGLKLAAEIVAVPRLEGGMPLALEAPKERKGGARLLGADELEVRGDVGAGHAASAPGRVVGIRAMV
ncbi:MAG TPA: hypothetical protein PK542_01210 [Treponemataceae bacterium]|nr:hypothetical protein [Treponemataceae bacterium]